MHTLVFLFSQIWTKPKLRIRIILSFMCLVLAKVLAACTPLAFKLAVDGLIEKKPLYFLASIIVLYAVTRVMSQVLNEFRDGIFSKVTQTAVRDLGIQVFEHLHKLDLSFHLTRQTGGLNRTLDRGIKGIETFFRLSLFNLAPTFFEVIFVFIILWAVYGFLYGFIALVSVLAYVAYTLAITQRLTEYVRTMHDSDAKANTRLVDSLLNYETVKYFNNEQLESKQLDESLQRYQTSAIKNDIGRSFLNAGQSFVIAIGLGIMMFFAAKDVEAGLMTVGDFVLINTFLIQLYVPLFILGFAYREVKNAIVSMEGMFSFLKISPTIQDSPEGLPLVIKEGAIDFEDVCFAYNPERLILKHVSFRVKGGNSLGIVGETGSGKSTIAKLLFRFFEISSGRILIDGQSIQTLTQDSLRRAIGVVPQDTVLFNDTIFYNILYGNPQATEEEVYAAAKNAEIHDFILSLPQGYQTSVGERGLRLSGGEKQRVAIARVLLKKTSIFIFDESTSALDTVTEQAIQKKLLNVANQGFTTVIIAHRLSTIQHVDQILVLDEGTVAERGTHEELLALKGRYWRLWSQQSA